MTTRAPQKAVNSNWRYALASAYDCERLPQFTPIPSSIGVACHSASVIQTIPGFIFIQNVRIRRIRYKHTYFGTCGDSIAASGVNCKIYCLISSSIFCDLFQSKAEYSTDLTMPSSQSQNLDGVEPTTPAVPFKNRPFYRTKRGITIIITVGFFALLAVIVGAVVGSANKKKGVENGISNPVNPTPTRTTTPWSPPSKTFTWTRSGTPITSVLPPGIEVTVAI